MSVAASIELLHTLLSRVVSASALHEFDALLANLHGDWTLEALLSAFSGTSRQLGRDALGADELTLPGPLDAVPLTGFTADVAGRALLLLTVSEPALDEAVWAAYREGDTLEKLAVIRTLPLLPAAAQPQFVQLALDAGRTNDARLFEALACDNPFAARHYEELEWNKLVMKAAFVRAPLERLLGFARRENPELARMALEYVEEQESAGRGFPAGVWLGIAAFPPPGAVAKLLGYASHAVASVRLGAVRGLLRALDPRSASFLNERLAVEPDDAVRAALEETLRALTRTTDAGRTGIP
jgi:hypothetical protein